MRISLIAFVALALGGAKPAPAPVQLQPASAWKVDYSAASCILTRQFAASGKTYDFELTFAPIEKRAWLRIGSSERTRRFDEGNAVVEVDGVKLAESTHYNIFENSKRGTTREFLFPQFGRDVGHAAKTLRLVPAGHGDLSFAIADFSDAMSVMAKCMDDLHRSLGIDPSVLSAIAVDPQGWALEKVKIPRREFDLTLLYWVTPTGIVENCRVLKPTGIQDFDARVCGDVERNARLQPARNAAGAPIRAPVYEDIPMRIDERVSTTPLAD